MRKCLIKNRVKERVKLKVDSRLEAKLFDSLKGKTILVTGGTGSFGRCLVRAILLYSEVEKIIVFSRDEWKHWDMQNQEAIFTDPKIRYFLGDVRDKDRLLRAFSEVDIVVHAAALKQVPFAEYNPSEYIKTNVLGAMNIIDAAIDRNVEKVVALSTDKAVNPINLYGSTKLCSDKLFVAGNSYVGKSCRTKFSVVRYGNVIGSKGSVIPLFLKLKQDNVKKLPITDPRMTRFWITLRQAIYFVLNSLYTMEGGEIFVPKIPSMNVVDLAEAIAPEIEHDYCGVRAGEKLHEVLISKDDSYSTWEFSDHFIVYPQFFSSQFSGKGFIKQQGLGKKVTEDFFFSSDNNRLQLGVEELRLLLMEEELSAK
jgi:UDP-N-acetylglucosamine 4,6-dehydratase/5-epimerase